MGALRTVSLCLVLAAVSVPARAEILSSPELVRLFAKCAGRYSAETEHLWALDGPASEETARRRDLFVELIAAAGGDPVRAINLRVDAKAAQRRLLETATYTTGARARRAATLAARERAGCDRLLLGL